VQNRLDLDRGLISQGSRDLFARFPKYPGITNYFLIGNPVHRVHARWTGAGRAVHHGLTVARTEGTVALSPELGLWPLRSTEARRWGCTKERGTWELGGRLTEAWAMVWQPDDGEEQPRVGRLVTGEQGLRERRRVSWRGAVKSRGGARLL
jgi:hypothetical protein